MKAIYLSNSLIDVRNFLGEIKGLIKANRNPETRVLQNEILQLATVAGIYLRTKNSLAKKNTKWLLISELTRLHKSIKAQKLDRTAFDAIERQILELLDRHSSDSVFLNGRKSNHFSKRIRFLKIMGWSVLHKVLP